MARPQRNNVDYFPFICEDGNKMFYIEETYGNDGFATFVKILRELAKTNYHYLDLSKSSTMMFLSAKCKVSKEILEAIIKDLVELGKFDKTLWEENKIIWCQDFIDSIQDAYNKRNNKCITYEGLLLLLISLRIRKPNKSNSKVDVNTQSIVKNNIVNNIIDRKQKFLEELKPFVEVYGKDMMNEFYKYWTEDNKSGTKFKMELEKTWDTKKRLERWDKNNFTKKTQTEVKPIYKPLDK